MLTVLTILLQFLLGFGIIDRFGIIERLPQKVALSILSGFFISTNAVFVLELLNIRLTSFNIIASIAITALAVNYRVLHLCKRLRLAFTNYHYFVRIYELVFLAAITYILFFSVWRTYAIPVTPYDSIVGIDLVAKQAIREGHIVSSIFQRQDFRPYLSTQPYYAPFTMLMQVIFRATGLPFGQLWLGILTLAFFMFAYHKLCETLHPVIVGFMVLMLATSPELYAYTFLLQTDFSNAVFFAIGMIYTIEYLRSDDRRFLLPGALFMGAACWSRTETILLVVPVTLVIALVRYGRIEFGKLKLALVYMGFCGLFTGLWNIIFFKFYFPVVPEMKDQLNWKGTYSIASSGRILSGMNDFFFNPDYWGYFIHIFLFLCICNLVITRRRHAVWPIVWVAIFYSCFFVMLHHFTLMNIEYTFRRAVMKFLLLMCLMTGHLHILQRRRLNNLKTAGSE